MATVKLTTGLDKETGTPNPGVRYTSGTRAPLGLGRDGQPFQLQFAGSAPPPTVAPMVVMTIVT